ncbi:MAG: hypothetical protein FJZ58_04920 [Chlamydiae bacterium]|nr:hypothetical protein [Chlamydiota bacterium]
MKNFLCIFLVTVVIGISVWSTSYRGYFVFIPVVYDEEGLPMVEVQINGRPYWLQCQVGSRFPLFLDQEILHSISAKHRDVTTWHELDGTIATGDRYIVPSMQIGELSTGQILAVASKEGRNLLGNSLGKDYNLLLDFPHGSIMACDDFSRLIKKNIASKDWVQLPFTMTKLGVTIPVSTSFGVKNFVIATFSPLSVMRSSYFTVDSTNMSACYIRQQNFGDIMLHPLAFPSTEELDAIDGWLGMDFLQEHCLYIDFSTQQLYLQPCVEYFSKIPVIFAGTSAPLIEVQIEDVTYPMVLDLGTQDIHLQPRILRNIRKTECGSQQHKDHQGNLYISQIYRVPTLAIGNLVLPNIRVQELSTAFLDNNTSEFFCHRPLGFIGSTLLKKYNLLLDFSHHVVYACKELSTLQKQGLISHHLLAVPLLSEGTDVIITAKINSINYNLLVDTGFTKTSLRNVPYIESSHFYLGDHDFGEMPICSLQSSIEDDSVDGYLGMDFLSRYPIFIDYINKCIFIDIGN